MTKEEKIKEAWSEFGLKDLSKVDKNGWLSVEELGVRSTYEEYEFEFLEKYGYNAECVGWSHYRPKSLQGIENNNGWSYIPSINDKEIEKGQYWVMYPNRFIEVAYYDGTIECYKFWKLNFTHYQPIEKPKPPIY